MKNQQSRHLPKFLTETNVGSTGTVESEDGSNSKTIDTTDTGTSTTLGTQEVKQKQILPMSGSKISEGTDQSKLIVILTPFLHMNLT
jgi:hypothetical protein